MGQARETQKLIDANWHSIYRKRKLIAAKLISFTVLAFIVNVLFLTFDNEFSGIMYS